MLQQWKIIVIGSPSQQLAWYGWMTEARVNPFHTTAAEPQFSVDMCWLHPRMTDTHVTRILKLVNPRPRRLWKVETSRQDNIDGYVIHSCLCFHAKETLWQFEYLYVPTTQFKSRIAILGIPLQWSCLMREVVFLASPRLSPPPTASHCRTGSGHVNVEGTKQRHPAILVLRGLQLRVLLPPTDWNLYMALKCCQAASSWERTVRGVTVNTPFLSCFPHWMYGGTHNGL